MRDKLHSYLALGLATGLLLWIAIMKVLFVSYKEVSYELGYWGVLMPCLLICIIGVPYLIDKTIFKD